MSVAQRLLQTPRARLRRVAAVARVTFWEIIRDKVLYNIVIFTVLLLGVGFLASRLTFARPERVVLDFGLSALSLACVMIAIFGGATLLPREFERRTLYLALSKPLTRPQFVVGKFGGLAMVILLNAFLLSIAYVIVLALTGGGLAESWSPTLGLALFFLLLQSWMLAALAVAFSALSTASLASFFGLGIYLVGNNISQIRFIAAKIRTAWVSSGIEGVTLLLPNLEYFSLGTKVTYGLPVGWTYSLGCIAYATVWIAVALAAAGFLVKWREI